MRIACSVLSDDLEGQHFDVAVLPEGTSWEEVLSASALQPNAVVVGAVEESTYCRAVVFYRGENRIDYLKVLPDGSRSGSGNSDQSPIFEFGSICLGVLVCRDIQDEKLSAHVIGRLKESTADVKLLCIPADMGSEWFSNQPIEPKFDGVYVALSNNIKTHQVRCKSFVAAPLRHKIAEQVEHEPIFATAPLTLNVWASQVTVSGKA